MSSNNNALPRSLRELFPQAISSLRRFAPCFAIRPSATTPFILRGPYPLLDFASLSLRCQPRRPTRSCSKAQVEAKKTIIRKTLLFYVCCICDADGANAHFPSTIR